MMSCLFSKAYTRILPFQVTYLFAKRRRGKSNQLITAMDGAWVEMSSFLIFFLLESNGLIGERQTNQELNIKKLN